MKAAFEHGESVRLYVCCLSALAFVLPEDVAEAFDILAEAKPVWEGMLRAFRGRTMLSKTGTMDCNSISLP